MKIAFDGRNIAIKDADGTEFSVIKSWGLTKWDPRRQQLTGAASFELLEKLSKMIELPTGGISPKTGKRLPDIAGYYRKLCKIRKAVDRERLEDEPAPIMPPPVKSPLYKHQIRGYNMAMLTFGWAEPPE